eukprot:m51a1_g3651 Vesicle transport protein Sec22A (234) ;mRNA; f:208797-209867
MTLVTLLARVSDGLILCESGDATAPAPTRPGSSGSAAAKEDPGAALELHRAQAKQVFRKLGPQSPARLTIDADKFYYAYVIKNNVCFLTICERVFPKKLAYDFLAELAKEFETMHGPEVASATSPYSFIKFDTFIQKTKRVYQDSRSQSALSKVSDDLREVQSIMNRSIQEILERGDKIDSVMNRSEALVSATSQYGKSARDFERHMWWQQRMPIIVAGGVVVLFIILRVFFF